MIILFINITVVLDILKFIVMACKTKKKMRQGGGISGKIKKSRQGGGISGKIKKSRQGGGISGKIKKS